MINFRLPVSTALSLFLLAGCGGGGDSSPSNSSSANNPTELEGTWIAATDGRSTGGACGLDVSGNRGQRTTLTFNMNRYSFKEEGCVILTGNTGSYFVTDSGSGTFSIGEITRSSADPTAQMRALDLISAKTVYTSYNLSSGKLRVGIPFQTYDGTTRDRRAFQIGSYYDPSTRTLITAPVFTKM